LNMELLNLLPAFLLVLVRVTAFFVTVPLFSYHNIPTVHKIGFSFFLAWVMFYTINPEPLAVDGRFFMLILKEALVGLSIGIIAMILMYGVQVAGGFIDLQMGFAIAGIMDPQTGIKSPLIGKYLYIFALLFLLSIDAHHLLIDGIFYSYQFVPLNELGLHFGEGSIAKHVTVVFTTMFAIAFQMAIPVVGTLFLVDVALGMISRAVPQVNVFIVGLPLKIMVSFLILLIILPVFFMLVQNLFEEMMTAMRTLMRLLGGT
jgi:flagellar biosynthetic protein FliR